MHESFHKDNPVRFTRSWFAWVNTLFGELIVDIEEKGRIDLVNAAAVYDNIPDELLLTKIRQSDKEAFVAVYERYHKVLYVVSYRYLKEKNGAKDVVQDVFTTLWERRKVFR